MREKRAIRRAAALSDIKPYLKEGAAIAWLKLTKFS